MSSPHKPGSPRKQNARSAAKPRSKQTAEKLAQRVRANADANPTRKSQPGSAPTAAEAKPADIERAPPPDQVHVQTQTLASVPLSVRWGDLDAFNHVNNATFLVYAQEARLAWLAKVDGTWFDETMMPVVAAAQVNFRRQLEWPAQIVVELIAQRVGTSSVTIAHRVLAASDASCLYADGEVVMVWVEPTTGRSVSLPAAIRSACGGAAR